MLRTAFVLFAVFAISGCGGSESASEGALDQSAGDKIGNVTESAPPARDKTDPMRQFAAATPATVDPADVSALVDLLSSEDEKERLSATFRLERLGAEAKDAAPALAEAMKDESAGVRAQAANALGAIGADAAAAVPALVVAADDEDVFVRMNAAWALEHIAPRDERTAAALLEQLEDPEAWVRVKAAQSLWAVGGEAEVVVPVLVDALAQKDVADISNSNFTVAGMRQRATYVLEQIGAGAIPVLENGERGNGRGPRGGCQGVARDSRRSVGLTRGAGRWQPHGSSCSTIPLASARG